MSEPSDDAPTDEPANAEPPGPLVDAAPGPSRPTPSPLVRRLAVEFGVDLDTIDGTGPGGRVVREDVQRAAFGSEPLPGSTDAELDPAPTADAEPDSAAEPEPTTDTDPTPDTDPPTSTNALPASPTTTDTDPTPAAGASIPLAAGNPGDDPAPHDALPDGPTAEPGDNPTRDDAPAPLEPTATPDHAPTTLDEPTSGAAPTLGGGSTPRDHHTDTNPVPAPRDDGSPVAAVERDSADGGQHPPVLGMTIEVDGAQLVVAHERLRAESGRQISLDALLVKLVAATLPEFPELATDPASPAIAFVRPGELGLDRATVVGAAQMSLTELDVRMDELVRRSTAVDASRPALTVIDGGRFGVTAIAPTLAGATAAVAFGSARPTVTIVDGSPKAGATLSVTGVFDDSVVDLARAAAFLNRLRIYLEDPILAFVG